jgi:5-methylcytosine-specific restriction protein A
MAEPSRRTTPLPTNWPRLRNHIRKRDGQRCTWIESEPDGGHPLTPGAAEHPDRCGGGAGSVDHIGDPRNHSDDNLRTLCAWHHDRRTAQQANAAKPPAPTLRRPRERHPGLIS